MPRDSTPRRCFLDLEIFTQLGPTIDKREILITWSGVGARPTTNWNFSLPSLTCAIRASLSRSEVCSH